MAAKKTENKEKKKTGLKFSSRKFLVWMVSTGMMLSFIVLNFRDPESGLASSFMGWWGGISLAYIGGNVAQDFIFRGRK